MDEFEQMLVNALVWFVGELEFAWDQFPVFLKENPWYFAFLVLVYQTARRIFYNQMMQDYHREQEELKGQVTDLFDDFCDGDDDYTSATGKR